MRLQQKSKEELEINLTPLIDVVFLLLIFFMITTTFKKESDLELALPEASGDPIERESQVFELVISDKGFFFIDGRQVVKNDVETLKTALQKALRGREDQPFIIRADEDCPHKAVIRAMDAASQLDISRISFATSIAEEADGG